MHIVFYALQQCLPFTVLKLTVVSFRLLQQYKVATVLTVYGIETDMATNHHVYRFKLQQCLPFTVLKLDIQLLYLQKELTCCNSAYRLRY